jgi:hypothetical protein
VSGKATPNSTTKQNWITSSCGPGARRRGLSASRMRAGARAGGPAGGPGSHPRCRRRRRRRTHQVPAPDGPSPPTTARGARSERVPRRGERGGRARVASRLLYGWADPIFQCSAKGSECPPASCACTRSAFCPRARASAGARPAPARGGERPAGRGANTCSRGSRPGLNPAPRASPQKSLCVCDKACPFSTGGGTRRVQSVRERGGRGRTRARTSSMRPPRAAPRFRPPPPRARPPLPRPRPPPPPPPPPPRARPQPRCRPRPRRLGRPHLPCAPRTL